MDAKELYAQGDVLVERVDDVELGDRLLIEPDPDGAVVVARGEASGHRHVFHAGAVMFRDDGLARDVPASLYLGHIRITAETALLVHDEHDAITLREGTYRVRRQREYDDAAPRVIED